ncbi:MAG: type II toxin-antitoxin system death-on-curing family toxin [Deltaproteobacteria bacterium]|nr:type II toxin-antitoxin system death-on-curing family toxin [Deltaproteobacteria bacterium]MBW1796315.1 type II toxin-antitoxin system death-on-curing family toxin [Deltaproteobacteria bacterium]MBW2330873.1 type II toxin-antitoxin system death-on-curing family toxin [Deltaproteobacteria bacterium]
MMRIITVADVEYLAFRLAKEHLSFNEPIPDFSTRFPNVLESCVVTPFQKFSGKALYPSLVAKAGILFYLMIKNHPFQNGNKRIAITTLLVFLLGNGKWIKADPQELYNFTVWVAQSPAELNEEVVAAIQKFIRNHLTDAD